MRIIDKSKDDKLDQFKKWYRSSADRHKDWRTEAKNHYDYYAGRQWTAEEQADMEEDLRQPVTFNRIGALIDAVSGHQINNRQETRYLPRQIGDVNVSEVLTGAAAWIEDEAGTEDEEEEIFRDICICGMGWSEVRMSYEENPDGQLIPGERFSPLEAHWDPSSNRRNIEDSKWRMRGRWWKRMDAEERWPEIKKLSLGENEYIWEEDESNDEPHDAARAHFYENDSRQWYNKHNDEIFIMHVQWWDLDPIYRVSVPDQNTGQPSHVMISADRFETMKEYLDQTGTQYLKQMVKRYYYAILTGAEILEEGPNSWPEGFTLLCATGRRDAQKREWFGLVRALIDPQKWSNKFLSDLQDMIVSNRQGGAYVEESALVNPRQAEDDWNTPNPLIQVRDGALQRGAIQDRAPPPLPPATDRMLEWCLQAIPSVSGISQEFMGYAERDQPNVLEMQRKRSAINVLSNLFSSLRKYRKDKGEAMLYFIREYMNDGRLIRVVGGDGTEQYIPLALDERVEKYDIVIDESSSSPNQKDETFAVFMALLPHMVAAGVPPPIEILDYMPLPSSFVAKWKEILQPSPPSEQEQMQQQIMQEAAVADIEEKRAEAEYKRQQAAKAAQEAAFKELEQQAVKMGLVSIEDL